MLQLILLQIFKTPIFHLGLNWNLSTNKKVFPWKTIDFHPSVIILRDRWGKKSVIVVEKSRFPKSLILHNYRIDFFNQSLNSSFVLLQSTPSKNDDLAPCIRALIVQNLATNFVSSRYSTSVSSIITGLIFSIKVSTLNVTLEE